MTSVPLISVKQEMFLWTTCKSVFIRAHLWDWQAGRCLVSLPPRRDPDLAVSFHSASLPSFTQISSSSVNSSWDTCSSSSSVPRMNWTRWDGVSDGQTGKSGKITLFYVRIALLRWQHRHISHKSTRRTNILTSSCSMSAN